MWEICCSNSYVICYRKWLGYSRVQLHPWWSWSSRVSSESKFTFSSWGSVIEIDVFPQKFNSTSAQRHRWELRLQCELWMNFMRTLFNENPKWSWPRVQLIMNISVLCLMFIVNLRSSSSVTLDLTGWDRGVSERDGIGWGTNGLRRCINLFTRHGAMEWHPDRRRAMSAFF